MSEVRVNPSPLDRVAWPGVLTPRVLATLWLLLGACTFVGTLQTQSSVVSSLGGLMVMCTVMASPLLSPRAAKAGWVALAVALLGLYCAEQQGWVTAQQPEPLLGLTVGLAVMLLGGLQGLYYFGVREGAERWRIERETQAELAAEEAARVQSEFISVINHEIRTPLNGIVGLVTLIQDERVDTETRYQYVQMLEQCSLTLSNRVSGILDFSQKEEGRIDLVHEPFSIKRWALDLEGSFSASAAVKGLFLQVDLDVSAGDDAIGDAGRLRQIAANCISNAIKFTKAGTIRVHISRPRGDDLLRLEVRDSGIGLTDSGQPPMLKPRQHPGAKVHPAFGGAGWGLSLCERLAKSMGGAMGALSLPGVGSTLWVEVPLPVMAHVAPVQRATFFGPPDDVLTGTQQSDQPVGERSTSCLSRPLNAFDLDAARVLVVDDNAVSRITTSQMLRRMNAVVTTANDGQEALDAMRTAHSEGWPFDLVLMDVQMPGMDGLTAVGLLRADPSLHQTPVVALTAGVLKEDVTRAIDAGMDGFLAKPVTAELLGRNVAHFADKAGQRRRAARELKF